MTRVIGIGGGVAPARRAGRALGGFRLAEPEAGPAAGAAAATGGVAALLALQEGEATAPVPPPAERARRRAQAALAELQGLQLDLLRGAADPARLDRLAGLAETAADPADPVLREAVQEVALRVRVELARRRIAPASG
jgi:hypothetical protein